MSERGIVLIMYGGLAAMWVLSIVFGVVVFCGGTL